MKLLLTILAVFTAFAATCPPPFNNARFVGNNTAELIQNAMTEDGLGWSEAATHYGNPITAWPRREDGIVRIKYCFASPETEEYRPLLEQAWKRWTDVIGAPGQDTGHRLVFEEFKFDSIIYNKYCYTPVRDANGNPVWNRLTNLPEDTVVIAKWDHPDLLAQATSGYKPENFDPTPGRHQIWVGDGVKRSKEGATYLAHEMGHLFGLWHEHQRPDRDHYVRFQCENLYGYEEARNKVQQQGQHTMEQVCASGTLGFLYDFAAPHFSIDDEEGRYGDNSVHYYSRINGPNYDLPSIMHYSSELGADPKNNYNDVKQVPLVKWKDWGPHYQPLAEITADNAELIGLNVYVSFQDRQAIQYMYYWDHFQVGSQ